MATIRKRRWRSPAGEMREAWQVDFVDQAGKRRHKQFERKKDADGWLVKARNQVADGTFTPESTSKSIKEACDLWIGRARAEDLERSTINQYERSVEIVLALLDPDTRLARLTTPRVEQLRDDLLRDHSRAMAQKALKHFKGIIKDAKRRGLIAHNPAADTTIGTAKRHKARLAAGVDFPLPAELRALIEAATGEALAMFCLAAFAGLRASEIRGLRWADLDLGSDPTVTVAQRADKWAQIGSPKSAAAQRTVPLGEDAAQALRAWKLAQPPITYREDGEKRQRPPTLVFGTRLDRPDTLPNIRSRLLAPVMIEAGVSVPALDNDGNPVKAKDGNAVMRAKYGLHRFRHFAVSSWLAAGFDLKTCQTWAGHADLSTTINLYGHLIPRRDSHDMMHAVERGLFG
jgi:integrase